MNRMDELLARDECLQLMTAYCTHIDERNEDEFLALFTEDAVFTIRGEAMTGKEPIRATFKARPASLLSWHLMLNHRITLQDEDRAEGFAVGLVIRGVRDRETWPMPIRGIELVMHYRMLFRREGGKWLIARCDTQRRLDIDAPPAPVAKVPD